MSTIKPILVRLNHKMKKKTPSTISLRSIQYVEGGGMGTSMSVILLNGPYIRSYKTLVILKYTILWNRSDIWSNDGHWPFETIYCYSGIGLV